MLPVAFAWRPLAPLGRPHTVAAGGRSGMSWWWATRPALLVLFAAGVVLGMVQSALLAYLPVFAVQALGYSAVGAGMLIATSQAGGAVARLGLGAASDRWLDGRRPPWLVLTSGLAALVFLVYALIPTSVPVWAGTLAFVAGVGAYGWVGIYFIISAEAGGSRHSGLLSGVSFAAIVVGLLTGAPIFGLVLDASDSYTAAWSVFAAAAGLVAIMVAAFSTSIDRECRAVVSFDRVP
jgi:sugar phosphate permease